MDNKIKIFVSVLVIVLISVIVTAVVRIKSGNNPAAAGIYDTFATCLGEKGAKFYGAYWCPHCADQKKLFGSSAKLLPYVECSTLDGSGQTAECIEKKIASYPTWEFADGSRLMGEIPLQQLADKTSCTLPVEGGEAPVLDNDSGASDAVTE